jgi:uncharacterized protein (TIGR00290 family)
MPPKAIFNWSTGKDSAFALHKVLQHREYDVRWLLTTVNTQHERVSMHGVRTELLEAQADALGISLVQVRLPEMPTMESYERAMIEVLTTLRDQGAEVSIFGDIFLEDLRTYREQRLAELGLRAVFPIWQTPTDTLVREVIDLGFKAVTTCVNERYLDRTWAGRVLDASFVQELPAEVDPCGENGEFHTFVFDGPIFAHPIPIHIGEVVHRTYERSTGADSASSPSTAQEANATAAANMQTGYDCRSVNTEPDPFETGFWYCDLTAAHTA